MLDRRKDARQSSHRRGVIKFGAAGQQLPCTIEDLNFGGAGLHVATTFGVPRTFQLTIDGDPISRHCKVVWAEGKRLGVSFD
jgi:hypothetical protein